MTVGLALNDKTFNSSYVGIRLDLLRFVHGNQNIILDIGCATGANGQYLLGNAMASEVVGIEENGSMAAEARQHLSQVVLGSIEDRKILARILRDGGYDYILLGDVLEHLVDPWKTLKHLVDLLSPNGKILLSVPNVQHIDVFIQLFLKGRWPYNERGIFDKTHLRWFTLKNVQELVDGAGLEITELTRKYRYRDRLGSKFPFYGAVLKRFLRNYYTFQYIVLCERRPQ